MEVVAREGKITKIKTLDDAFEALNDAGPSLNSAYVYDKAHDWTLMVYDAMFSGDNQAIEVPHTPDGLQNFLYDLFKPFLYDSPSDSRVSAVKAERVPKPINYSSTNVLRANMFLYFKKEFDESLHKNLEKAADSVEKKEITVYYLD